MLVTSETDSARLARMEGKLDAALKGHEQRLDAADKSRATLHEKVNTNESQITSLSAGVKAITAVLTLAIAFTAAMASWVV